MFISDTPFTCKSVPLLYQTQPCGIFKIVGGLTLPKGDGSKGLLVVNGVLALIIGVLLLSLPFLEGLLTMAILIAFFGIFSGIMLISLAFVAKSAQGQIAA
ncbi:MAG: DUF308 domain-containing protein [Halobacteriota archaeon]